MSNQVYYILARVGANSIGLYVESSDFDSAYDVAEERIAQSYKGPFTVQALQLIRDRNTATFANCGVPLTGRKANQDLFPASPDNRILEARHNAVPPHASGVTASQPVQRRDCGA
jgi:hypothetical protein